MKQKRKLMSCELPKVDYKDTKRSWFTHAGKAYPVISAPADVFSAAVLARYPKWKFSAEYSRVLKQDELDYHTRWWLLCCLADNKCKLKLYDSKEAAERACTEQMVG